MSQKNSDRLVWAVESLDVGGDERLLEIGCGHGVAVSLVCAKLSNGTITAIDRSPTMIEMAQKRNQAHMAAGKAIFHCTTLEDADFGYEQFDKIFAIRVNFFIQQPERQLPLLKKLLLPGGAIYLVYDAPLAAKTELFIELATQHLQAHGFALDSIVRAQADATPMLCVITQVAER